MIYNGAGEGVEHDWLFLEVEKIWLAKTKEGCCAVLCKEQGGGVWQRFLTSCTVKKLGLKTLLWHEDKNIPMQKMPSLPFQRRILFAAEVRYL